MSRNGHRSAASALDRIAELAQAARSDPRGRRGRRSAEASRSDRENGRGTGFTDSDPTGTMALDPTRAQLRRAARRAAWLVFRAEEELEQASAVVANGFLRLDREEWIRAAEKRAAALQGD